MVKDIKTVVSPEGHRQRIRERFLKNGGKNMPDYEFLEAYLTIAIPRRDVKPLAKILIAEFGSFCGVVNASEQELLQIDGVGENTLFALKMIKEAAIRMSWQELQGADMPVIGNMDALIDYCRMTMGTLQIEEFRLIFLNAKNRIIAEEVQQRGTINHVTIHPREVVNLALAKNAAAVIMAHNHPTGDVTPSKADIEVTKLVRDGLKTMDILLHDHVVIGKGNYFSFRDRGLL